MTLKLNRIDSYNAHTLLFGGSTSGGFSASLAFSFTQSISKGTGSKSIDLTDYASVIQGFGGTWHLHIHHGSGTNSYTEFNGDEDASSKKPQLIIVYDLATVRYRNGDSWVECEVWYRNGDVLIFERKVVYMAIVKVPVSKFVDYIQWCLENKCGYIMGAYGQDPKKWVADSWWFTQYKGEQRRKALYWRENAPLVMDCNGLAEGCYLKETGVNINARARNNYSAWCSPKGTGKIPVARRVAGAAVFIHNGSYVSHVGFLWKPVVADKPEGDWWVIEARGVLYGVVATKFSARGWNRWGLMTKYFDYS